MEKKSAITLNEVIFSSSEPAEIRKIGKLVKQGIIRKIAPRIYTPNLEDKPGEIIKRNIFYIIGHLYPRAVLSHRSALEFKPTATGDIFVTYKYTKKVKLPGIVIHFLEGPEAIGGDTKFSGELYVSQKERALLENMQISKRSGNQSKTLTLPEIEEKLEQIIQVHGEEGLNKLRDRAREIARKINMKEEFDKLNLLISSLLSTQPSRNLKSSLAKARALGIPFDKARIQLFEILFRELASLEFKSRPDRNKTTQAFRNFAFFESYFSNYIEGTVFEIEEAKKIIETGKPIPLRNEDSHDILGTYAIVSNKKEISIIPDSPEALIEILQRRHNTLMHARKDKKPGQFKEVNNRAGNTFFVDFKLVRGTLIKGYEYYQVLKEPFARAAYIMFLISEVHPFVDGNGRIARVMMNAELVKNGQSKIIIPTVYREDYLLALKKLTNQSNPDAYIKMMQRAHEFSEQVYAEDINEMQVYLESCNAFYEHTEGRILKIIQRK